MRGKGKTFFHVKKSFSLPPAPPSFFKKSEVRLLQFVAAEPLAAADCRSRAIGNGGLPQQSLWRRRIAATEPLAKTDGRVVIIDYLPILETEQKNKEKRAEKNGTSADHILIRQTSH